MNRPSTRDYLGIFIPVSTHCVTRIRAGIPGRNAGIEWSGSFASPKSAVR